MICLVIESTLGSPLCRNKAETVSLATVSVYILCILSSQNVRHVVASSRLVLLVVRVAEVRPLELVLVGPVEDERVGHLVDMFGPRF